MLCMYIHVVTTDVQSVNVTVVGETTIDIQCWFIHGSDAVGCKVVLVSNYSNISDMHKNISRRNNTMITSAFAKLNLTHNISCYHRVFAFGIDINNIISNLTIEGIINTIITNDESAGKNIRCTMTLYQSHSHSDAGPLYVLVTVPILLLPFTLMVVALSAILCKNSMSNLID